MLKFILMSLITLPAIAGTIVPFEREIPRVSRYYYITSNNEDSNFFRTAIGVDDLQNTYFRGYSILNPGPNDVIPSIPEGVDYPSREFFISTEDHARRETHLWITDYAGTGYTSDYFESMIVFLPRKGQQYITENDSHMTLTLTTGEDVIFFKKYKTIVGGVLSESPLDMNPDRSLRKYAQIEYTGEGLMIRTDAKGNDPRLAKTAHVTRKGLPVCDLPGSDFWTQEGHPKFKFVNDEEAYAHISKKCGPAYIAEIK